MRSVISTARWASPSRKRQGRTLAGAFALCLAAGICSLEPTARGQETAPSSLLPQPNPYQLEQPTAAPQAEMVPGPGWRAGAGARAGAPVVDAPRTGVDYGTATAERPAGDSRGPACGNCQDCRRCSPFPLPPGRRVWRYQVQPWLCATHWGYPEYFSAEPLGLLVHEHFNTQVANGQAAQLILYRCDFDGYKGESASRLNEYGLGRLRRFVEPLSTTPLPLMIEGEFGNPELNASRRQYVLGTLAVMAPVPISPERVVIVAPPAALAGVEAVAGVAGNGQKGAPGMYENMLRHTSREGVKTTPDTPKWRFDVDRQ
jgi:hypothetical protein